MSRMSRFEFFSRSSNQKRKVRARTARKRKIEVSNTADHSHLTFESLEQRILLAGDLVIDVNEDITTIHDETAGLQNTPAMLDTTTDENGNDIAVAALPTTFSDRLSELGADPSGAIGAALSGYDGSNSGADAFTITGDGFGIDNLALTDANGDPLDGLDSGLTTTVGGNTIFLYTDSNNDNIVLGREGTGTTADPNGNIVLAIYLDESPDLTAGKFWTVQYEAMAHDVPGDGTTPQGSHDEPLDLTNKLFVTASRDLEFDLTNAPSGQNLFIMFGDGNITDGNDEVGIVATGRDPANESDGESITTGDTVNTSQAGGPTTFGINNQMLTASAVEGEGDGIYFTFVTGPNPDFTVPNLTQTEADVEANIQFNDFLGSKGAEFEVVQLQGGKTAVVKVTALNETQTAANASGVNFVDELNDPNDLLVTITSVVVFDFDGGGELNGIDNGDGTFTILPDPDGTVTITGVEAGDIIKYFTDGDHNRVLIENTGDDKGQDSANFDIGGFRLLQADAATADVGQTVYWEDDGPQIELGALNAVTLQTYDSGTNFPAPGNTTPNTTTDSITLDALLGGESSDTGNDGGTIDYELTLTAQGVDSGLDDVATGGDILLYNVGDDVIEGRVGTDVAFRITLSEDGNSTIDAGDSIAVEQLRSIKHADGNGQNTASMLADKVMLSATITDGDNDTATDTVDVGNLFVFNDDIPAIELGALNAVSLQTYDSGTDFPAPGNTTPNTTTDSITLDALLGGESSGTGSDDATIDYELTLSGQGVDSGLDDVATGADILLYNVGDDVIEGRVGADVAFRITLSEDGNSTIDAGDSIAVDQLRSIKHADGLGQNTASMLADKVTLSATITDGDVDTASDTVDVGNLFVFIDDIPAIELGAMNAVTLETYDSGTDFPAPGNTLPNTTTDSITLDALLGGESSATGSDDATIDYELILSAQGVDSGLDDVATGGDILLYNVGDDVIEGRVGADVAFRITLSEDGNSTIDAGDSLAVEQLRSIKHADGLGQNTASMLADKVTLSATITDGDVDTATDTVDVGNLFVFNDDIPAIELGAMNAVTLETYDSGTNFPAPGNTTPNTTTDSITLDALLGGESSATGSDDATIDYELTLSAQGVDSGLDDVATGGDILLYNVGDDVIEGRVGTDVAFRITLSEDGNSTIDAGDSIAVDQLRSIKHADGLGQNTASMLADKVTLSADITDGDVDIDSDTVAIGNLFVFNDDIPAIELGAMNAVTLETYDSGTNFPAPGNTLPNTTTDSITLDALLGGESSATGSDDATIDYALTLSAQGVDSGLDDVATGGDILLYNVGDEVIEGRVGTDVAFRITLSEDGNSTIDAGDSIAVEQLRSIKHADGNGQNSASMLADKVTLSADITDEDVDTASDTVNVGNLFVFNDDIPAIELGAMNAVSLQTYDSGTDFPAPGNTTPNTTTDSITLDALLGGESSATGSDDATIDYALTLSTQGVDSGLDDVATGSDILLYNVGDEVIEGRVGAIAGPVAFTITLSEDGDSTIDAGDSIAVEQLRSIKHADGNGQNTASMLADKVTLSATITDGDVDTATDTANIGNLFVFNDDVPQIDIDLSGAELRTDDRSLTAGSGLPDAGTDTDTDTLTTIVTNLSGADGQQSLVYTLGVSAAGVDSGVDDVATGNSIFLFLESGEVVGRVGTSETMANPAGAEAFRVTVDGTSGAVTLTQSLAIEHGVTEADAGAPDYYTTDVETLTASAVTLTATLTDGDVDVASDNVNIGDQIGFTDDGPDVEFSNLVGTVTTDPQLGFWTENTGADQPGTVVVTASDTFEMVTADGITSTGTVVFDGTSGTGTLTADFDNDPGNGDESITFSLIVNSDGTYVFTLDEVLVPVVTLSTDEGQLPAGGPDPVQTLSFVDTSIVFFAVDASTANNPSDIAEPPLPPATFPDSPIKLGELDLTEAELQAQSAMADSDGNGTPGTGDFAFIRDEIAMNVSTTGIGVNNNVFQGQALANEDSPNPGPDYIGNINPFDSGAFDESFVINPEPLASEVKVYISKTAGGFLPPNADGTLQGSLAKTDYLYYNVYDELGNFTAPILVTSDVVFDEANVAAGGTGENLWSFTVDLDTLGDPSITGDFMDAIQFTMGFGDIKIPKIEVVVRGNVPPNDILLDFSAVLTDADGDSASTDFAIDLLGYDVDQAFDYTLVDAGDPNNDAFNVNVVEDPTSYLVQGFVPDGDQLYLLNGSNGFTLNTGSDLGVGDPGIADSEILVDGVTVIVEDATLTTADITEADTQDGLNFLAEEEPVAEDDGLLVLVIG